MLIERAGKGARAATVAPAEAIDVGHRQRRPVLGGGRDLGGFAHLALAVAVDLGHRDLGDAVVLEERQQVVGEVVRVAAGGVLLDLELLGREPIGRELVEGRVGVLRRRWIRPRRPPRAEVDVAKHDRELALRHRQSPAVLRLAQGQVLALAVGAKAQREAGLAWCRLDHLSSCGACHRLPDPVSEVADQYAGSVRSLRVSGGPGRHARYSRLTAARLSRRPRRCVGGERVVARPGPGSIYVSTGIAHAAAARPSPYDRHAGVGAGAGAGSGSDAVAGLSSCLEPVGDARAARTRAGAGGLSRGVQRRVRRHARRPRSATSHGAGQSQQHRRAARLVRASGLRAAQRVARQAGRRAGRARHRRSRPRPEATQPC